MSNKLMEAWERRADAQAKRRLLEAKQRNERHFTMRVRCPGCGGDGLIRAEGSLDRRECCPVCKGVGMAAYDWTRSEQPRALRGDERQAEEAEKAEKNLARIGKS